MSNQTSTTLETANAITNATNANAETLSPSQSQALTPTPNPYPLKATKKQNRKPTSPRQLRASRTNGSKSKGPTTPEGLDKCYIAASTLRSSHNLLAKSILIQGECESRFFDLLEAYIALHRPSSDVELDIIFRMAVATWRQRRVISFQATDFNREIATQDPLDAAAPAAFRAMMAFRTLCEDPTNSQASAHRYESTYERQYQRAVRDLALLRGLPPAKTRLMHLSSAHTLGSNWATEPTENTTDPAT